MKLGAGGGYAPLCGTAQTQAQAPAGTDTRRQAQTGHAPAGSEAGAVAGEWQGETFGLVRSFRLSLLGWCRLPGFPAGPAWPGLGARSPSLIAQSSFNARRSRFPATARPRPQLCAQSCSVHSTPLHHHCFPTPPSRRLPFLSLPAATSMPLQASPRYLSLVSSSQRRA
jgi:hypothetical protein